MKMVARSPHCPPLVLCWLFALGVVVGCGSDPAPQAQTDLGAAADLVSQQDVGIPQDLAPPVCHACQPDSGSTCHPVVVPCAPQDLQQAYCCDRDLGDTCHPVPCAAAGAPR